MIDNLTIKNFKTIKECSFKLSNLNVLMGINGMGKSTFIQSLLLLKQSERLAIGEVQLNGSYVNLGNTKDALYQYSRNEGLSIDLEFNDGFKLNIHTDYVVEADVFTFSPLNDISRIAPQSLFNNNFQYLNANRLPPTSLYSKSYTSVVTNNNVGNAGEFVTHFIEVRGNEDIFFENLIHPNSGVKDPITEKTLINKTLINQLNLWMGEISPGINIRTTSIPNSEFVMLEYVYKQPNFGNTNRFKPSNVGFGISYVLPVVTAILAARPGELIIIENPESHIHPRGQSELGKLIGLAALNNIQIIVETHSDHILNGIRVASKEITGLSQRVVLFYFERLVTENEQFSKITPIKIDTQGELSEYPENLIDEWGNQLLKLF